MTFKLIRLKLGEKLSQVWLSSMCENSCSRNAECSDWRRSPLERVGVWYLPSAFPCLPENVISGFFGALLLRGCWGLCDRGNERYEVEDQRCHVRDKTRRGESPQP